MSAQRVVPFPRESKMQACMQQRMGVRAFASGRPSRASCVRVQANSGLVPLVQDLQKDFMKKDLKKVAVGDSVKVGLAVVEGKGANLKTRTQSLEGVIIADQGTGLGKSVTFRRIFQGVGMELVLPVHAPVVQSMDVIRHGRIRRSKLYYLRDRVGKSAKLKEIVGAAAVKKEAAYIKREADKAAAKAQAKAE